MDKALFASPLGFAFVASVTPDPDNLLLMSPGKSATWVNAGMETLTLLTAALILFG